MGELLKELLIQYPLIAPLIFIIGRAIPVVFAPIPGILVDLIGLYYFTWWHGFILAEIGILIGSAIVFWIARKFREPLLKRYISIQKLHSWEDSYSEKQKFWGLVFIRLTTSPMFDYISYAAGLTKISFSKYMLTTFIGTLPLMFGIYYFGSMFIGKGPYIVAIGTAVVGIVVWIIKKRSEKKD
jgi:uncharacterized membrane protein YdjX (TVP38/TMEM64 family)